MPKAPETKDKNQPVQGGLQSQVSEGKKEEKKDSKEALPSGGAPVKQMDAPKDNTQAKQGKTQPQATELAKKQNIGTDVKVQGTAPPAGASDAQKDQNQSKQESQPESKIQKNDDKKDVKNTGAPGAEKDTQAASKAKEVENEKKNVAEKASNKKTGAPPVAEVQEVIVQKDLPIQSKPPKQASTTNVDPVKAKSSGQTALLKPDGSGSNVVDSGVTTQQQQSVNKEQQAQNKVEIGSDPKDGLNKDKASTIIQQPIQESKKPNQPTQIAKDKTQGTKLDSSQPEQKPGSQTGVFSNIQGFEKPPIESSAIDKSTEVKGKMNPSEIKMEEKKKQATQNQPEVIKPNVQQSNEAAQVIQKENIQQKDGESEENEQQTEEIEEYLKDQQVVTLEDLIELENKFKEEELEEQMLKDQAREKKQENEQLIELKAEIEKENKLIVDAHKKCKEQRTKCMDRLQKLSVIQLSNRFTVRQNLNDPVKMVADDLQRNKDSALEKAKVAKDKLNQQMTQIEANRTKQKNNAIQIQTLKEQIQSLQAKVELLKKEQGPKIKNNNVKRDVEIYWQDSITKSIEKSCEQHIPTKKVLNDIKVKIDAMDEQSDKWCRENNFQEILDIDVKKYKFQRDERLEIKLLNDAQQKTLVNANLHKKQCEQTKQNINLLKDRLLDAQNKSSLLDEDIMDLITLEHQMEEVLNAEHITKKDLIEKFIAKPENYNM